MSGRWVGSTRHIRLPKDWRQRVAATKDRARGRCEGISLDGEDRWHDAGCDGVGAECDHDQRGDDHRLTNLRWLNPYCHLRKTQHEAAEAQREQARKARHPGEQHPGLR